MTKQVQREPQNQAEGPAQWGRGRGPEAQCWAGGWGEGTRRLRAPGRRLPWSAQAPANNQGHTHGPSPRGQSPGHNRKAGARPQGCGSPHQAGEGCTDQWFLRGCQAEPWGPT